MKMRGMGRAATWSCLCLIGLGLAQGLAWRGGAADAQQPAAKPTKIAWPGGQTMALSLSFDDGRASQVLVGTSLLARYKARATFYVTPGSVEPRLAEWKRAVADGHEIGSHSVRHPCSGNFPWSRDRALEDYTIKQMAAELKDARRQLERLLGVNPVSFAYPCGQTYIGRGRDVQSYVPVVAELHQSGRGWLDEAPNDPAYCDMAQLTGMEMDGKEFPEILALIEGARKEGQWLILAGHEIGAGGRLTTRVSMLEKLLPMVTDPAQRIWLAPVGEVATHVLANRRSK